MLASDPPDDAQPFLYFREDREVTEYHCNLPHWRQPRALYFVTFRLGDSLPKAVLDQWKEERNAWLNARGARSERDLDRLPRRDRYEFARHFNRKVQEYLDTGHGECWLRYPEIARLVERTILHFDGDRCAVGEYVVMPNHIHVLVAAAPDWRLNQVLHSWKSFTAHEANGMLGRTGKFWQRESYDRIVRDAEELAAFRRYIAENPMKTRCREGEHLLGGGSLGQRRDAAAT